MNIIIVGNGKVGYTLAQYLTKDGHDVTVLDKSQQALLRASETLDVMCVRGNGANVKTLIEAGVETADIIIAVTGNDELNMVCCLAVAPEYRRNRFASMLLEKALGEMDRTREITVSTFREDDEKGTAPRALYRSFGFREGGLTEEFGYPNQVFILPAQA